VLRSHGARCAGGAAAAIRQAVSSQLTPVETAAVENTLAQARIRLGERAFAAAWEAGRTLPIERSVAEALATERATPLSASNTANPDGVVDRIDAAHVLTVGSDLTRRERDVLALLCKRLTDIEIADRLFISPRTASTHVGRILDKLGASNRRDAAAIAARHGWA
jgi:DNA-binding CsgD family transcriptional regulator